MICPVIIKGENAQTYIKMKIKKNIYIYFACSSFIIAGQMGERWGGVGSGKVLEFGQELGMPVAQQHYMSACCPQGCRRRHF